MNELMIHIERIVRPLHARQSRKLRMRRELLAHLQAAVEEERDAGADGAAAIERAIVRLGDPAELTRNLQRSVPSLERTLMSSVPAPRWLARWQFGLARLCGLDRPLTMFHALVLLSGTIAVPYIAAVIAARQVHPSLYVERALASPGVYAVLHAVITVVFVRLAMHCGRFAGTVAQSAHPLRRLIASGIAIIVLLQIVMFLFVSAIANHAVTMQPIALTMASALVLLAALALVGGFVRLLRAPYEPWLTLDVAQ